MMKRILMFFAIAGAVTLACGKVPTACALTPMQPQPQYEPPKPLPPDFLEPALKKIPTAPQVNTGNSQGGSAAGGGEGNSGSVTAPGETAPQSSPPAVKDETPPPTPVETAAPIQAPEPSKSKLPWLLVAGGVVAAFILGRRTK